MAVEIDIRFILDFKEFCEQAFYVFWGNGFLFYWECDMFWWRMTACITKVGATHYEIMRCVIRIHYHYEVFPPCSLQGPWSILEVGHIFSRLEVDNPGES